MLAHAPGLILFKLIVLATYDHTCSEMSLEHFGFTLERSAATLITSSTAAATTTVVTKSSISAFPTQASQSVSLV